LSSPSNLYAEKVFSEHPVALWNLDDQCDYISYVTENNRKFYDFSTQWEYSGFTPTSGESGNVVEFSSNSELVDEEFIFKNSAVTKISPPAVLENETGTFSIESRFDISVTAKTFSVALYSYSDVDLESITITAYSDGGAGYTDSQEFTNLPKDRQNHLSATFETSVDLSEVYFLIEVEYPYSSTQADIYLSGFSVGSLSEEFSATSLGIESYEGISERIALSERDGVKALAYGSDNNFGYYLIKDNTLLAKNSSIPMVYGASNSTIMHSNRKVIESNSEPTGGSADDIWFDSANNEYYEKANFETTTRTNLVTNPSFETNLTGWTAAGFGASATRTTAQAYTGTSSAETNPGGMGGSFQFGSVIAPGTLTLTPSTSYVASAWVKGSAGQAVAIRIVQFNSSGSLIDIGTGTITLATSGWERVSVTDTTQSNVAYAVLQIVPPSSTTIYVDAVQLELGTTPSTYFDGSTAGASWAGTANESVSTIADEEYEWIPYSTNSNPGIILPGKGFLNAKGQSSTLTFEAWLRVNSNNASQRIMGPISSEDGLYVDGPFLVFRVGDKTCSHFVGEWFRPMLVDLTVSSSAASMLINGELVASIDLSDVVPAYALPENEDGESQDWIGMYAYGNVTSLEVDCVAIYPYEVTEVLAKKRFVSGQGVPYPQDINVAYSGESMFIDYIYANYAKNYEYPATSSWLQGVYDNLDVSTKRLASPTYVLPKISSSGGDTFTMQKLESDLHEGDALSLRQPSSWSDKNSYMYFDSLNILQKPVLGFFGIFEKQTSDTSTNKQTLIKITNNLTQEYFVVSLTDVALQYSYKVNGQEETIVDYDETSEDYDITKDERFVVGVNIEKLVTANPSLRQFFSNRNNLSVQLLGDYSGTDTGLDTTFSGLCHSVGFCTAKNVKQFEDLFTEGGIIDATENTITGASYELVYQEISGIKKIEIKTRSYWESHVPLSSLSKLSQGSNGNLVDRIDFIQFNVDYPQTRPTNTAELDPRNDLVKTYVSFQYMANGANKPLTDFTELSSFDSDRVAVVEPGANSEDWDETLYQVVDGTIIYPPAFENNDSYADVALCMHFEINSHASISNKTLTRFVKLGAQSLSDNSFVASSPINKIGTKFGKGIYPYKANEEDSFPSNISYSAKNPFKIFRGSGPHLYLTHNSGISIVGEYDEDVDRGIFARINREATADTNISSMQMAMLWNNKLFPTDKERIFEVDASTGVYKFYVEAIDSTRRRGKITVTLTSGAVEAETNNVFFYWNGSRIKNPVMTIGEWGMVGVVFKPYLVFNNSVGYIKITSPMIINNISTYQLEATAQAQQIVYKTWQDIEENAEEDEWDEWYDPGVVSRTWEDAFYKVATFNPSIDPSEIYKTYIGTNKIIADSASKAGRVELNKYQYVTYGDVQRDSYQVSLL